MKPKPISPLAHGIIDYAFAAALLSVPTIIHTNKKVKHLHLLNTVSVIAYSVFTKYPPAIKQIIPLHVHKKIDCGILALLALQFLLKDIRKDKKAIIFHAVMLAAGITTVQLTNWNENSD